MPGLIFTWVKRSDKRVQFELLDNSVRWGERPRTVAFGSNRVLYVLDVKHMLDVERYRRVNVDATTPGDLYRDADLLRPEHNTGFLKQCLEHFPNVSFADQATGRIYLEIAEGVPVSAHREALESALADPETRAALIAIVPSALDRALPPVAAPRYLGERSAAEGLVTLGAWGSSPGDDP